MPEERPKHVQDFLEQTQVKYALPLVESYYTEFLNPLAQHPASRLEDTPETFKAFAHGWANGSVWTIKYWEGEK